MPRLAIPNRLPTLNQIALHPGSGSESKNWPETQWAELLGRLVAESEINLLLVGGEAEGERLQRLAAQLPSARHALARSLPLAELAARLQSGAGFVGHDSGISHLAAALGLPCVVLWANTLEAVWRPHGRDVVVLRDHAGLPALRVQRVLDALRRILGSAQASR